jgi:hypothetical protein|tara:strand:- start:249 stop:482 length:234 start_codon:yes stop_codon:yes gene_type:complete
MDKEINIDLPSNIKVDKVTFQKMLFITNAIDKGWSVKKSDDNYIFTKKHENRKEIFKENYLEKFLFSNLSNDDILKN